MRVLLTGIDGYLGAVMAPVLARHGHEVTGLDAGFYRDGLLYGDPNPSYPVVTKDIRQVTVDDLRGFDAVVHLAELSNDPLAQQHPRLTHAINGEGSEALARRAKQAGVRRFLYSSSCSVYGMGDGDWKTEDSPTQPLTPYAACKLRTELVLAGLADETFSPTCLRNATAFGASPRMRFDIVLNGFAGHAWTAREIVMTSDGTPWRPLVHALDIAAAFAAVLDAPIESVHGEIFNVGCNEQNYRVREIAEVVSSVFAGCSTRFGPSNGDGRSYRVAFDKIATKVPAFRCHWSAEAGAVELRQLFDQVDLTPEMFQFRAYTRLSQLEYLIASERLDHDLYWKSTEAAA